jgi:ferritin-like metal-binding protein YciE
MTAVTNEKNAKTIADYLGDMHAIESHIEEALDRQLDMFQDQMEAKAAIQEFHDMVKRQRDELAAMLPKQDEVSKTAAAKDLGASLLGKAAGMIDKVRTESESKALRDDYTAFNLAAISYAMLYTTATGLGDQKVAQVSDNHLRGYARAIQRINHLTPGVVVHELAKDGHTVSQGAAAKASEMIDAAWKATS